MKYIDADKLRKLLANRYEEITVPVLTDEGGLESFYRRSEIHDILKIVDSLQQEQQEVDLEEDIEKTWLEYEGYNECYDKVAELRWNEFDKVARHFYELGKNSK